MSSERTSAKEWMEAMKSSETRRALYRARQQKAREEEKDQVEAMLAYCRKGESHWDRPSLKWTHRAFEKLMEEEELDAVEFMINEYMDVEGSWGSHTVDWDWCVRMMAGTTAAFYDFYLIKWCIKRGATDWEGALRAASRFADCGAGDLVVWLAKNRQLFEDGLDSDSESDSESE